MNKQAELKMIKGRVALIVEQPFWGTLALNLKLMEDSTLKPPTMATNGRVIKYHPDYVMSKTQAEVTTTIAHEVGHCALKHMSRRKGRQATRWNWACDYAVNEMLQDSGFRIPNSWLIEPAFKGMSAEEIYALLPDMPDDGNGQMDSVEDAPPDQVEEIETDWKTAVSQAAAAAKAKGTLPWSIKRMIDEMHEDPATWRERLMRFATRQCKSDYAWSRPNRRMLAMGYVLPGMDGRDVESMVVIADDSGSIGNKELAIFAGAAQAARSAVTPEKTIIMACDARVNYVQEVEQFEELKLESHGGGGTDFRPPFAWLEQRDIKPSCLLYLTDGYGEFPDAEPDFPVLWCMTTDVQPPWGEVVKVDLSGRT